MSKKDKKDKKIKSKDINTEKMEEITLLNNKIKELEDRLDLNEKEYILKLAELDNSRKRMEKESQKQREMSNEKLIVTFLDILDNLELALKSGGDIREGIDMIINQFNNALSNEGVVLIDKREFNPEFHNAVSIEEGDREGIEEIRRGYMLKGRVIRPSLVKILKKEA